MRDEIRHWTIYMYTFPNGKRYIGKTCRPLSRRQGHDFCGYERCTLLWKAIQKYGIENIEQEILVEEDMDDYRACELEQEYIAHYQTNCSRYNNPAFGYNLTDGGEGVSGWKPSEERYEQLCEMMREFHERRRGVKLSDEHREKLSRAKLGKKHGPLSEETKRKLSIANSRENMSYETHVRRSESKKKRVLATHKITGNQIEFDSLQAAAEYFGVCSTSVHRWCHGIKNASNGHEFQYVSTDND